MKRIRGPFEFVEWMLDVAIFTRQATVVEPRARSGWRWRIVDQLPVAGMDQLTINQLIEWYGTFSLGLDMPEESDEHAKLGCPAAETEFAVKAVYACFKKKSKRWRKEGERHMAARTRMSVKAQALDGRASFAATQAGDIVGRACARLVCAQAGGFTAQ